MMSRPILKQGVRFMVTTVSVIIIVAVAIFVLNRVAGLPENDDRQQSQLVPVDSDSRLARATEPLTSANPGKAGLYELPHGLDAFAARVVLIRSADYSIDIQYYIWDRDDSGALLLSRLIEAADRGVRVRLLIDDFTFAGNDRRLAAFAKEPGFSARSSLG